MFHTVTALSFVALLAGGCAVAGLTEPPEPDPRFPEGWSVVDLTRPLDQTAPYVPGPDTFPLERIRLAARPGSTWQAGAYSTLEQAGTHVAAPVARRPGGATVDRIPPRDLLVPLVVVDVPDVPGLGANFQITEEIVTAHEVAHGPVPQGSLVLLRTGRGTVPAKDPRYSGRTKDGKLAFPGWSESAVRFLATARGIRAVGTDAMAVDPGELVETAPAQTAGSELGLWFLVNLGDLGALPPRGAFAVVGVLPLTGGTGAQARVLALVPPQPPKPRAGDRP